MGRDHKPTFSEVVSQLSMIEPFWMLAFAEDFPRGRAHESIGAQGGSHTTF